MASLRDDFGKNFGDVHFFSGTTIFLAAFFFQRADFFGDVRNFSGGLRKKRVELPKKRAFHQAKRLRNARRHGKI